MGTSQNLAAPPCLGCEHGAAQNDARDRDDGATWQVGRAASRWKPMRRSPALPTALALLIALSVGGCAPQAPVGRAPWVPDHPLGTSVYLAPLDDFPAAALEDLAAFYRVRYDLPVEVLPAADAGGAWDPSRGQMVAEDALGIVRTAYAEGTDQDAVVIAVTRQDLYIRNRPDWAWAFGWREQGRLGVLSTARMLWGNELFPQDFIMARLRRMMTKYIGVLYFGLEQSDDPTSVLYGNILSLADLDAMGEDF